MKVIDYLKKHPRFKNANYGETPVILHRFGRTTALLDMFNALDYRIGAEIGTEAGRFASNIVLKCPQVKLYCIDPWMSYGEAGQVYSQKYMDNLYWSARSRLKGFNCKFIKKTSMEAVKDFELNSLDFVFIDGNHEYKYVLEDIEEWTKIVKPGGVICGHDYQKIHDFGVVEAVQKYTTDRDIKQWFVLQMPKHRSPRKQSGFVDCWMFVKP